MRYKLLRLFLHVVAIPMNCILFMLSLVAYLSKKIVDFNFGCSCAPKEKINTFLIWPYRLMSYVIAPSAMTEATDGLDICYSDIDILCKDGQLTPLIPALYVYNGDMTKSMHVTNSNSWRCEAQDHNIANDAKLIRFLHKTNNVDDLQRFCLDKGLDHFVAKNIKDKWDQNREKVESLTIVFCGNGDDIANVGLNAINELLRKQIRDKDKMAFFIMPQPLSKSDGVQQHTTCIQNLLSKYTNIKNLNFCGHSLGAAAMLEVLSSSHSLQDKIKKFNITVKVVATFRSLLEFISPFHMHSQGLFANACPFLWGSLPLLLGQWSYRNRKSYARLKSEYCPINSATFKEVVVGGDVDNKDEVLGTNSGVMEDGAEVSKIGSHNAIFTADLLMLP